MTCTGLAQPALDLSGALHRLGSAFASGSAKAKGAGFAG